MAVKEQTSTVVTKGPPEIDRQLRDLEREAALKPDDPDKQLAFAMLATTVGAYADALNAYHRTLELREQQGTFVWIFMGIAAARTGHHEDALRAFSQVAEAAADDPSAWVFKAMALENLGRLVERQEALEHAAALEPRDPKEMVMVGFALGGLERYREALAVEECAIRADPDNPTAWANKGMHIVNCGHENANAAVQAFETALDRGADDPKVLPTILRNYGIALVELGRLEDALIHLE